MKNAVAENATAFCRMEKDLRKIEENEAEFLHFLTKFVIMRKNTYNRESFSRKRREICL